MASGRLREKLHDHKARFAGSGGRSAGIGAGGALTARAGGAGATNSGLLWLSPMLPAGTRAEAVLDTLPGKKPLIKLTYRPPNYESPLAYLRTAITPNDEFFVRYHLADIPQVDAGTPIDPAAAKTIGDYLKENYGESEARAPPAIVASNQPCVVGGPARNLKMKSCRCSLRPGCARCGPHAQAGGRAAVPWVSARQPNPSQRGPSRADRM
jgi:hypothetical protein